MIQYYSHYLNWEDFNNGMYDFLPLSNQEVYVFSSIKMLTDLELFLTTSIKVIGNWPISTAVNFTNKSCNRKAWLGQACCSYAFKSTEVCTRVAWGKLTHKQQFEANNIADNVILNFELNYETKNTKIHF